MDAMPVFSVYLLIWVALIVLQVIAIRKKQPRLWMLLFLWEVLAIAGAYAAMRIFDGLPGHGEAPGLTYFSEVAYSIFACILYTAQCFLSIVIGIIIKMRHKRF